MPENHLPYPEFVLPTHRHQYCPVCTSPLVREVVFDDGIPRVRCRNCGWIQFVSNAVGVVVAARHDGGVVAIMPPGEAGVALPAGLVEYGESPEEAALREIREETGLEAQIVRSLGWFFTRDVPGWPGPQITFMYEARIIGGHLAGSNEWKAKVFPLDSLPPIAPGRRGSQRAMEAFLGQG